MIILWEDEVLKVIMPEDFLEYPERYELGQGVQHIYKGNGKKLLKSV